jgi:hypothetical protein
MGRIAVGIVAFATLAAGLLLRKRTPRPVVSTPEQTGYQLEDLYKAGL